MWGFFWLKRFKQPDEETEAELVSLYELLNENNRALVLKSARRHILLYLIYHAFIALLLVGAAILFAVKIDVSVGLIFLAMGLIVGYFIYADTTWYKAKDYQKILLVATKEVNIAKKQEKEM